MKDEIDLKDDDYCLVSYERFNEYLDTIKHNAMLSSKTQRGDRNKLKSASGDNDNTPAYSGIIPKK